jgi:hypothetical protein
MSDNEMTEPVMDGANDATNKEKLDGLKAQVDQDHAGETDEAKAEHLGKRMDASQVHDEPESD